MFTISSLLRTGLRYLSNALRNGRPGSEVPRRRLPARLGWLQPRLPHAVRDEVARVTEQRQTRVPHVQAALEVPIGMLAGLDNSIYLHQHII